MKRRDFVTKLTQTACIGALTLAYPFGANAQHASQQFKVGASGQLLVSEDGGTNWVLHTNFGPEVHVCEIRPSARSTTLCLRFRGRCFRLRTTDARRWLAVS